MRKPIRPRQRPTITAPSSYADVGGALRAFRRYHRHRLHEVAVVLGITPQHLSDIEHGRRWPTVALTHDIAVALDMTERERDVLCGAVLCLRGKVSHANLARFAAALYPRQTSEPS